MESVLAALMIGLIATIVLLGILYVFVIVFMGGAAAVAVRRQKRDLRYERSHMGGPRYFH